jgi:hypothetical protein
MQRAVQRKWLSATVIQVALLFAALPRMGLNFDGRRAAPQSPKYDQLAASTVEARKINACVMTGPLSSGMGE